MMRASPGLCLLALLPLTSCTTEPTTAPLGGPIEMVVAELTLGRADQDGASPGFDLDQHDTAEGDAEGCGVPDYVGLDGRAGVDNGMAPILPLLDLTEAAALEQIIQQSINDGTLLMVFRIDGLDDPMSDDEIQLSLLRAQGTPILDAEGQLVSGQTFDRDEAVPVSQTRGTAENGILRAEGLSFLLPFTLFDFTAVLDVSDAVAEIRLHEDGTVSGLLSGGLEWQPLQDALEQTNVDQGVLDLLGPLLSSSADLGADCELISVVLEFEAIGAFIFAEG